MIRIYRSKKNTTARNPFVIQEHSDGATKLAAGYRLRWTEEGMLGQREAEASGEHVGRNISRHKLVWLMIFLSAGFFLLLGKAAYLQARQGDYYSALAEQNRLREEVIRADRGVIYDRSRNLLAYNTPVFSLKVTPAEAVAGDASARRTAVAAVGTVLGEETEQDVDYLLVRNQNVTLASYQPVTVAYNITHEDALRLQLVFENVPGLRIVVTPRRRYVLPSVAASHVLGYTGTITAEEYQAGEEVYLLDDTLGKTGLERYWESELRGLNGRRYIEVDALGQEKRLISVTEPQDGASIVLGLDSELQQVLAEAVDAQLKKSQLTRAAAIALDPRTGEVLAMVSLPTFDSNDFAGRVDPEIYQSLITNEDHPLLNRAIQGSFATGSTFKPTVAAAALQEGVITPRTTVHSTGGIRINQWFFPDWRAGGHGTVSVRGALAWSVNTFFYTIGGGFEDFTGLGVQKITDYARLFGLGEPLGIDLPNEASGFLPSRQWKEDVKGERWYIGDTYNISIGQGDIIASPLQVAGYTVFFANGGTLYRPHLVRELLNADDSLARTIEPEVIRHNFIDQAHIETVRLGMRDCVVYGSCVSLNSLPVAAAGKTGTAQWSSVKNPHSWFTGFAPFNDPEIVITVLIEEGSDGVTSSSLPVAREVLEWYFSR